jgi:glutathionylspermidine synthase
MVAAPYRAGASVDAARFATIRRTLVLRHCKWDPQVGDNATLADFPLLMPRRVWLQLATWAEALSAEALSAEAEILQRPELLARLGLPRQVDRMWKSHENFGADSCPRVMRYDFHFTREGWRISECNADVPGGYAEASELPALMAACFPGTTPAGDPGTAWAATIADLAQGADVALLSAAGFMEDHQVVQYLAARLRRLGAGACCAQPSQLEWRDGAAYLHGKRLGAVLRFYQVEWLASSAGAAEHYFGHARTPVLNPGRCALVESKRFPLVWAELRTARLPTWRELLPETVDPRWVPWQQDDGWLLKTAFCNTGDTVSVRSLMAPERFRRVARAVRWFPGGWIAQRRFEPVPLATPLGEVYPCIGVYTVAGRAAGVYARLSRGKIVDFSAVDAPLLVEETDARSIVS